MYPFISVCCYVLYFYCHMLEKCFYFKIPLGQFVTSRMLIVAYRV